MIGVLLLVAACGGATSTEPADEGRLITGEIESDAAAVTMKALEEGGSCIGEVCGVTAYNSDGSEVQGEIDPATNRWRVRVRNGNWMFGFLDGAGQRLGYLTMNGITALVIEDGTDVDLGKMGFSGGEMVMQGDVEGLGENGIRSYYGQDADRDGIPQAFGDGETVVDTSVFNLLFIRPYDGQLNVAPCRPVKIVFTKALDEATVTADTIKISTVDGAAVEGAFSVWEDAEYMEFEIVFAPSGGYEMGATIDVLIVSGPEGVLSAEGDALAADIATSFTVRDFGGTSDTCHDPDQERQQARVQERERARLGSE